MSVKYKKMKNFDNIEQLENLNENDKENEILFEDGQNTIGYFSVLILI